MTRWLLLALSLGLASCRPLLGGTIEPIEITKLECPGLLFPGEPGDFQARVSLDAQPPYTLYWDWGDEASRDSSAETTASHTYRSPGVYTVAATLVGRFNEDRDTCVVDVVPMGEAPILADCQVVPDSAAPGDTIVFDGRVANSDTPGPFSFLVEWGDGESAQSDAWPMTHRYNSSGTYSVAATVSSPYGSGTCDVDITIAD